MFFDDLNVKQIAEKCWVDIPLHFSDVELDEWIVMPNHIHGILALPETPPVQTRQTSNRFGAISPQAKTLSVIIRTYKAAVTTGCRQLRKIEFAWQRNYHERIIRNEKEFYQIRQYVLENPNKWNEDEENPRRIR